MTKEDMNLFSGDWIIDTCESADAGMYNGWIDVHCSKCGADFGLEEGQYGWGPGDPFPFLYCPMCGDDKRAWNERMKHSQEMYFRDLNDMADGMAEAMESGM